MNTNYSKLFPILFFFFSAFMPSAWGQTTQTFSYTGGMQTFTVPACVGSMTIIAMGAQGQSGSGGSVGTGGSGASASGVMTVTPGQV